MASGSGSASGVVSHVFSSGNTCSAKQSRLPSAAAYGIPAKLKVAMMPFMSMMPRMCSSLRSTWSGVPHGMSLVKSCAAPSMPCSSMYLPTLL